MPLLRQASEDLARRTTRRGFFGRGLDVAFGALAGAAAGTALRPGGASAGLGGTACFFPGPACECTKCLSNGTCAKPCVILTEYYATGCWITAGVTCCDCDCNPAVGGTIGWCGCGSDYHNNPQYCPDGNASG